MRVLHVVCTDAFAGVERHVAQLAAAEDRAGHETTILGGDPDRMPSAVARPRVRHVPSPTVVEAVRGINRHGHRHDILNVHMTAAEIAATIAIRARKVPVVATRHFAGHRGSNTLSRIAARAAARRIGAQIAISRYVADRVEGGATVVHPGMATRPDGVPALERERVVLAVQRLEPEKDTVTALDAFAASGLAFHGWRLDIAGDGSLREPLARHTEEVGIAGSVRFMGQRSDVDDLMRRAAVLIAPCPVEGLGLTVLEAMAAGLPVVTTRAGGHLETVGSVDGAALFAPGAVDEAARLLRGLAEDPAARDAYGRALQTTQRDHFTLAAQQKATEAVYRSVL